MEFIFQMLISKTCSFPSLDVMKVLEKDSMSNAFMIKSITLNSLSSTNRLMLMKAMEKTMLLILLDTLETSKEAKTKFTLSLMLTSSL